MEEYIDQGLIRRQAWKFYVCLLAWPLYLFLIPYAFHRFGWWSLVLMIFPGAWLFSWVAYLMHESWHKYVPGLPSDLFYYLFGFMLITDPQVYRLVHGSHHAEVHTWEDMEFHPWGKIKPKALRRLYNLMEIVFGSIFLQLVTTLRLLFQPSRRAALSPVAGAGLPPGLAPLSREHWLGVVSRLRPDAYGRGDLLSALLLLGFFSPTQLPA